MEGLLFLALMYWVYKKMSSAAKKQMKKRPASDERTKRMVEQIRRAQKEKQISMQEIPAQTPGEGESHMEFTRDVHGCESSKPEYMGSLLADTSEGEDACDLELGHERKAIMDPQSVYAGEIGDEAGLDLSPHGIYQGVVMSEILTRPNRYMRRRT